MGEYKSEKFHCIVDTEEYTRVAWWDAGPTGLFGIAVEIICLDGDGEKESKCVIVSTKDAHRLCESILDALDAGEKDGD